MMKCFFRILVAVLCFSVLLQISATSVSLSESEKPSNPYRGKVISILGDSISTFSGYIPVADGFNLKHYARYPQKNLLSKVNDTWWMQVLNALDAKLGINDSWRGTTVYNSSKKESKIKACLSSMTRIQNLGSNGTPDIIFFFGGTNDIKQGLPLGSFSAASAPTEVNLTSTSWKTVAAAYTATIMRLQHFYPNSKIVVLLPTYSSHYTNSQLKAYNSVFAAICKHYNVSYLDLRKCGITSKAKHLPDGLHPNAAGMDLISNYILEYVLNNYTPTSGENTVYSITHNLSNVKASLSHWKGVSDGMPFHEILTGENIAVHIMMGEEEVTNQYYSNGVISIPCVTGNLEIRARVRFLPGAHLQEIPPCLTSAVNILDIITPEEGCFIGETWTDKYRSVTIPVLSGDHLCSTSFGSTTFNGEIHNGIELSFFSDEGLLQQLTPEETYTEFSSAGYITVPEGTVYACIPLFPSADNHLTILNRPAETDNHCIEVEPSILPTCLETGLTEGAFCTACKQVIVAQAVIPALGHDVVIDPATEVSCGQNGVTEGSHCAVCNEVLVAQIITTPTTGHDMSIPAVHLHMTSGTSSEPPVVEFACTHESPVELVWYSNFSDRLSCDNGLLKALSPGAVVLTAETNDDAMTQCSLQVIIRSSNPLILPQEATSIQVSAFEGAAFRECVLPESLQTIHSRAFANNAELAIIELPSDITFIHDDAFADCPNLTLIVHPDSVGHQYAIRNEIPFILCDH